MKKIFLPVVAATALLFTACGGEETTTEEHTDTTHEETHEPVTASYTVNAAETSLEWNGYDVAAPEGHFHKGTVAVNEGSITTTDGVIDGGSIVIGLDALAYTEGAGMEGPITAADTAAYAKLFGHMSSPDFFNGMTTATFNITGSDENGVSGKLELLGQEVDLVIPGAPTVDDASISHTTDWFEVDLSSVVPYLGVQEGAEEPGLKLSMKLNLTASK